MAAVPSHDRLTFRDGFIYITSALTSQKTPSLTAPLLLRDVLASRYLVAGDVSVITSQYLVKITYLELFIMKTTILLMCQ
jgi:hypothetical protein